MAKADFAQIFIRANDQTKGAFDSAARNVRGLQEGAAKISGLLGSIGIGAALSVAGLAAFAKSTIDAADALKDMSDRTGVSVKDLASFRLAAEQSGTSLEDVGKLIAKLSLSVGQAQGGNKEMAESLKALGINAADPKERLFQLADAIQKNGTETKTLAALQKVAGKAYADNLPLLLQGAQGLRDSAKASESWSDAMARLAPNADKFNDELVKLKLNSAGAAGSILSDLLPALKILLGVGVGVAEGFLQVGTSIGAAFAAIANPRQALTIINQLFSDLEKRQADFKKRFADITAPAVAAPAKKPSGDIALPPDKPKKAARASDPQGAFVDRLRQEAGTLGLGAEALLRYEAAKLKLTGTNAKLANTYIAQIAAFKDQQAAAKASNEAFDEFAKKQEEADAATESAIKSLSEFVVQQQFEASLIGLTNVERETAIQLRAAETAGVDTQTESFRLLAEQVKAASGDRRLASLISDTDVAKTKEFLSDVDLLTNALFDTRYNAEQVQQALDKVTGSTSKASKEIDQFAKKAAENFQSALADFLFDPFKDGLDGMLAQFGNFIKRAGAEAIAADLTKALFGDTSKSGKGSEGLLSGLFKSSGSGDSGSGGGSWISAIASLFGSRSGFASGGVMSGRGPIALSAYAGGGIANRPQLALFGEGSQNEAFVPLPDGKRIPVAMNGGGGSTINITLNGTNNAPDVRRAGGQIAREISGLLSGASRYV